MTSTVNSTYYFPSIYDIGPLTFEYIFHKAHVFFRKIISPKNLFCALSNLLRVDNDLHSNELCDY